MYLSYTLGQRPRSCGMRKTLNKQDETNRINTNWMILLIDPLINDLAVHFRPFWQSWASQEVELNGKHERSKKVSLAPFERGHKFVEPASIIR